MYSKNLNKHLDHFVMYLAYCVMINCMSLLCDDKLYVNLSNCTFCMEKIMFLGYVVTTQVIEMR
jgi:hypothetical protein